jgi:hypothetical protein
MSEHVPPYLSYATCRPRRKRWASLVLCVEVAACYGCAAVGLYYGAHSWVPPLDEQVALSIAIGGSAALAYAVALGVRKRSVLLWLLILPAIPTLAFMAWWNVAYLING